MNGQNYGGKPPVSSLGRLDFLADINVTGTNTELQLPTQGGLLPNDLFLYGLMLTVELRMTNPGTNGPTGRIADAPFSLIESIRVEGYHRPRAAREQFLNVRGADLYFLNAIYGDHLPYTTHQSSALSVTASATNDVRFTLFVPFVPLGLPPSAQVGYLLDAPNYDNLTLTIRWADTKSVFTGQTTEPTISAFGSASGNARIRVHRVAAMNTNRFAGYVPARLWRYSQEVTSGDIISGGNNIRLFNLPKGYRLRSVFVKTGTKATTASAGNNVYSALTNTALSNIRINRGIDRPIRRVSDFYTLGEEIAMNYGSTPATGYALFDFASRGIESEAFDTSALVSGPTGDVDTYLQADVTGAANQAAMVLFEELRMRPTALIGRR
jgi:hypothetical protein